MVTASSKMKHYKVPPSFECETYDKVIALVFLLFGSENIMIDVDASELEISASGLYLKLNFSSNETKIYFSSMPFNRELADNKLYRDNYYRQTFRLFSYSEMEQYVKLKKNELDFIRNNQG